MILKNIWTLLVVCQVLWAKGVVDPQKIVAYAEELRSMEGARSLVEIENLKDKTSYELSILQASGRRAMIEFLAPAIERGRFMLAIRYRYWAKFKDSQRVVPITRKEALGNSAFEFGDLFQIDTQEDYKVTSHKTEDSSIRIFLDANSRQVSYRRIEYVVDVKSHYPLFAEFFGESKKHLKTMRILESHELAGKRRPSILRMDDHIVEGKSSIWRTKSLVAEKVPDQVFTQAYLAQRR